MATWDVFGATPDRHALPDHRVGRLRSDCRSAGYRPNVCCGRHSFWYLWSIRNPGQTGLIDGAVGIHHCDCTQLYAGWIHFRLRGVVWYFNLPQRLWRHASADFDHSASVQKLLPGSLFLTEGWSLGWNWRVRCRERLCHCGPSTKRNHKGNHQGNYQGSHKGSQGSPFIARCCWRAWSSWRTQCWQCCGAASG